MDVFASWQSQARKGIVELFVLELLRRRGPLHGYGLVQALDGLGDIVAGVSTVYPVLKRLESDGLVTASWDTAAPGNPRKYYDITADGALFLECAQAEWDRIRTAMDALRGEQR